MSDFEFREENTIEAVFSMEVGREMNDHNKLYNRYADDQHPISAITGLTEALAEGSSNLQEEISRAEAAEQALDDKIEAETTRAEGAESGLNTAITNETSARQTADTTLQNNITAEENRAKGIENGLRSDLTAETTARQDADTGLQNQITTNSNDIDTIEDKIPAEASSSNQLADKSYVDTADGNLQSQIDAISASSDVTDIVGTYAELQAYDTSTLTNDDIIKVLQDESQGGATTYYRWVVSGSSGSFVLIGSEGPYYTKAEADDLLDEKQEEITATNKLDSDLVDDSGQTNKFVTASEKAQISTNASDITALQNGKADKSTTYTKTEVDTIASGKANVGLDNLNADGQMIIDSQNGTISNCILEIPQNINLEISGSNVIIKSGSTLVDSGSTYTTFTLTSDFTADFSSTPNGDWFLMLSRGTGGVLRSVGQQVNKTVSGATDSLAGTTYHTWFDTENKIIKRYGNNTDPNVFERGCYPCAIINVVSGVAHFAKDSNGNDMIFNGAGFIGHHWFVFPNVTGLIPYNFDDDKKLKSIKYTTTSLVVGEMQTYPYNNYYNRGLFLNPTDGVTASAWAEPINSLSDNPNVGYLAIYVKDDNRWHRRRGSGTSFESISLCLLVDYKYDGTTVNDFVIYQPYEDARDLLTDDIEGQVEQNTADIATKQDTLVSGTNIKTINNTTVLGSGNFTLADQSLSNLDSTGQMVIDSQNGTISNCILEIPQNLSISVSGTSITLKGGSVCAMTGSSTYTTTTIASDITRDFGNWGNGKYYLFYNGADNITAYDMNTVTSGSSLPETGSSGAHFFLTSDFSIYTWQTGSSSWTKQSTAYSYPLCTFTKDSSGVTIDKDSNGNDMIFNGAGYIGHHVFYYPNPRIGLRSNRFNADGTLASELVGTNSLSIVEMGTTIKSIAYAETNVIYRYRGYHVVDKFTDISNPQSYHLYYVNDENIIYEYVSNALTVYKSLNLIDVAYDGTTVTQFDIRQPYEGARNLLTDSLQADVTTLTGYDSTQTQTLKNINGVLTWVTD